MLDDSQVLYGQILMVIVFLSFVIGVFSLWSEDIFRQKKIKRLSVGMKVYECHDDFTVLFTRGLNDRDIARLHRCLTLIRMFKHSETESDQLKMIEFIDQMKADFIQRDPTDWWGHDDEFSNQDLKIFTGGEKPHV